MRSCEVLCFGCKEDFLPSGRSSLWIEVPPGKYPIAPRTFLNRALSSPTCARVSFFYILVPIYGHVASLLPFDFISLQGGSLSLGGPINQKGQLLVREMVGISSMYDARKKVYLRSAFPAQLKISAPPTNSDLTFSLKRGQADIPLSGSEAQDVDGSFLYTINPNVMHTLYWSSLKGVENSNAFESEALGAYFNLILQCMSTDDIAQMGRAVSPEPLPWSKLFPPIELSDTHSTKLGPVRVSREDRERPVVLQFSVTEESRFMHLELFYNWMLIRFLEVAVETRDGKTLEKSSTRPDNTPSHPLNVKELLTVFLNKGDYILTINLVSDASTFPLGFALKSFNPHSDHVLWSFQPSRNLPRSIYINYVATIHLSHQVEMSNRLQMKRLASLQFPGGEAAPIPCLHERLVSSESIGASFSGFILELFFDLRRLRGHQFNHHISAVVTIKNLPLRGGGVHIPVDVWVTFTDALSASYKPTSPWSGEGDIPSLAVPGGGEDVAYGPHTHHSRNLDSLYSITYRMLENNVLSVPTVQNLQIRVS